jgi:hypothetical protein
MQPRATINVTQRTHSRVASLADGFGDSMEKILTRLLDEYEAAHGKDKTN